MKGHKRPKLPAAPGLWRWCDKTLFVVLYVLAVGGGLCLVVVVCNGGLFLIMVCTTPTRSSSSRSSSSLHRRQPLKRTGPSKRRMTTNSRRPKSRGTGRSNAARYGIEDYKRAAVFSVSFISSRRRRGRGKILSWSQVRTESHTTPDTAAAHGLLQEVHIYFLFTFFGFLCMVLEWVFLKDISCIYKK